MKESAFVKPGQTIRYTGWVCARALFKIIEIQQLIWSPRLDLKKFGQIKHPEAETQTANSIWQLKIHLSIWKLKIHPCQANLCGRVGGNILSRSSSFQTCTSQTS